jgi:hypothetical protein
VSVKYVFNRLKYVFFIAQNVLCPNRFVIAATAANRAPPLHHPSDILRGSEALKAGGRRPEAARAVRGVARRGHPPRSVLLCTYAAGLPVDEIDMTA